MTNKGKIKDDNPFRVPDNYFDDVKKDILVKTRHAGNKKSKTGISAVIKPAIMMAAAMLVFVIISYSILKLLFPEYNSAEKQNFSELVYDFDEAELIDVLADHNNNEEALPAERSEIIDYLMDNNVDYHSIIEYLH
ncbi:MAG: hypothetical protein V2I34_07630 [Bacteroidales bacterium]|jgi:hypothetical protein|nr:hypothetical protein [Bacteroidales bacterium]